MGSVRGCVSQGGTNNSRFSRVFSFGAPGTATHTSGSYEQRRITIGLSRIVSLLACARELRPLTLMRYLRSGLPSCSSF
jgi:hypothetical protein